MQKREFTLRKGIIVEALGSYSYLAEDIFTKNRISVSISGKERMSGLELDIDETIYIVVSPYDLEKGRYFSNHQIKGLNIDFKSLRQKLDSGIDPLNVTVNMQILKKVLVKEREDNTTYIVEDIFSSEKLIMKISGKIRMNYINVSINDSAYIVLPNEFSKEGKLIFEKYICLQNQSSDLCEQKRKIENLEKSQDKK